MAEYAIGLVNRLDWQGTEVQRILAELSEEASKTLPLDWSMIYNKTSRTSLED